MTGEPAGAAIVDVTWTETDQRAVDTARVLAVEAVGGPFLPHSVRQLFLAGYGLAIQDLRSMRTEWSLVPGHPEYGHTD